MSGNSEIVAMFLRIVRSATNCGFPAISGEESSKNP